MCYKVTFHLQVAGVLWGRLEVFGWVLGACEAVWCQAAGNLSRNKRGKYCCAVTAVSRLALRDGFCWRAVSRWKKKLQLNAILNGAGNRESARSLLMWATILNFLLSHCAAYKLQTERSEAITPSCAPHSPHPRAVKEPNRATIQKSMKRSS